MKFSILKWKRKQKKKQLNRPSHFCLATTNTNVKCDLYESKVKKVKSQKSILDI